MARGCRRRRRRLPASPDTSSGHPSRRALSASWLSGLARSGVKGPLICGSRSLMLISMTWSYSAPSSARRFSLQGGWRVEGVCCGLVWCGVGRCGPVWCGVVWCRAQSRQVLQAGGGEAHEQRALPSPSNQATHQATGTPPPPERLCQLGGGLPGRGHQVVVHAAVEGEHGGGGADLCPHVADGAHAWGGRRGRGEAGGEARGGGVKRRRGPSRERRPARPLHAATGLPRCPASLARLHPTPIHTTARLPAPTHLCTRCCPGRAQSTPRWRRCLP